MTPGQILVVSDDAEFVRAISARWQTEKNAPDITAVSMNVRRQASPTNYSLVVVGPLHQGTELPSTPALYMESTVCAVGDLPSLASVRAKYGDWLLLPEYAGWPEALFSVAKEALRRISAEKRAREAELTYSSQQYFDVLGRSLLEARPGMFNVLTSLLGNADLILMSEEPLSAGCQEQMQTIRTMALRLNEMLQRLSSLGSEMELSDWKSQLETAEKQKAKAP